MNDQKTGTASSGLAGPRRATPTGRFEELVFSSEMLLGNPLGDPPDRPLWVYLPPGYDTEPERRYPSVYLIQGLFGQLDMWHYRHYFRRTTPELVDDLFASGAAPPCIVVWVDAWTSLGGSQFLDSSATGRYHSYLCGEIVPWIDTHYRTLAAPQHRGIAGKSSGGYGAMVTAMLRPDLFGGFATHAGDALFEVSFLPGFRNSVRILRDQYGGSFDTFWKDFRSRVAFTRDGDDLLLCYWCLSACFAADDDGTVRLPFDTTGALIPEVWQRWLDWDPVRMVPHRADALRSMKAIWVDAGRHDDYFLDLAAQAFVGALAGIGVTDVHFELFDGTHDAIEYRYPLALAYLATRLSACGVPK